ncbi:uncharacterized protein LOC127150371 [Cucumis melo]|uniref:Uncharacterized protein LOC127150371 n=1 Tax=Cucumis melo TaxID=3656 RepID=A0ABM3L1W8_CUCME|nr:uncharacterized protein LOC127150371 [Cucumis melo]
MNSPIVQLLASEKLNDNNYAAWKSNLNMILVDDLRFVLTKECPQTPASNANRTNREAYDRWIKANEKACVCILASMSDVLKKKHESLAMAKEITNSLRENSSWKRLSGEITLKVETGEMVSAEAVGELKLYFGFSGRVWVSNQVW